MKEYNRIDPNTYDCKFIYVVKGSSLDAEVNYADKFESVLSFLSNDMLNSKKFDEFLYMIEEIKFLYVLAYQYTEVDWDLIREYARIDDLEGIINGLKQDVEKLYEYIQKHRLKFLKDF